MKLPIQQPAVSRLRVATCQPFEAGNVLPNLFFRCVETSQGVFKLQKSRTKNDADFKFVKELYDDGGDLSLRRAQCSDLGTMTADLESIHPNFLFISPE